MLLIKPDGSTLTRATQLWEGEQITAILEGAWKILPQFGYFEGVRHFAIVNIVALADGPENPVASRKLGRYVRGRVLFLECGVEMK